MKFTSINYLFPIAAALLLIILTACSNDSTSPELTEPPALPTDLTPVVIETQYFAVQDISDEDQYSNFKKVQQTALFGSTILQSEGAISLLNSFLALAPLLNVKPELIDNSWVWTFNLSGFLKEADVIYQTSANPPSVTITATPSGNNIEWEVKFTGLLGEVNVQDFVFITGTTANDFSSGEWRFFDPEGITAATAVYNWQIENETTKNAQFVITSFGDFSDISIDYKRSGPEFSLNFEPSTGNYARIFWNIETHSGWYEDYQTSRMCYTNFVNSECS